VSIQGITKAIESQDFSSVLGFANNSEMYRELLRQQPEVLQLVESLKTPSNARELLSRIDVLVHEQDDIRFRNSRDSAIAVYIWAINELEPTLGRLAASLALSAPRLWWARQVAAAIFGLDTSSPSLDIRPVEFVPAPPVPNATPIVVFDVTSNGKDVVLLAEVDRKLIRSTSILNAAAADLKSTRESTETATLGGELTTTTSSTSSTTKTTTP